MKNSKEIFDNTPLIFDKRIPLFFRIAMPIFIAGTVAMFIVSNAGGAAVKIDFMIDLFGSETVHQYSYDFKESVQTFWDDNLQYLAVLVAFYTAGWPYVKLLLLFFAWVFPPKWFPIQRRENVLIFLDVVGKWAFLDFFVLTLLLVGFTLSIDTEISSIEIIVEIYVRAKLPLYLYVLAIVLSLVWGHISLHYHRLTTGILFNKETVDPSSGNNNYIIFGRDFSSFFSESRESLFTLTYEMYLTDEAAAADEATLLADSYNNDDNDDTTSLVQLQVMEDNPAKGMLMYIRINQWTLGFIIFVLLGTGTVILLGTLFNTVQLQYGGLMALLVSSTHRNLSFAKIGRDMFTDLGDTDVIATRLLQVVYFLLGMVMPIASLWFCFILWVIPLPLAIQRSMMIMAEICNAWSALDVFCVSLVATFLQIERLTEAFIGSSCSSYNLTADECFALYCELLNVSIINYFMIIYFMLYIVVFT
jgi:hypothetical protein